MRHPAPLALCLLAALPLTAAGAPASVGTPEEQALRAALTGHDAEAVSLLARGGDPELTWLAGRYALQTGDYTSAGRLLAGTEPRQTWGQIDLLAARGDYAGALAAALPELDAAMAGTHRDAMAKLLVGWAKERMSATPADDVDIGAVALLQAATAIQPSLALQDEADLAGFRLPDMFYDHDRARRMLARTPAPPPNSAWLALGGEVAPWDPRLAVALLGGVLEHDEEDAPAAAEQLASLASEMPPGEVLPLLERAKPTDAVLRLRLDTASALVAGDAATGLAALDRLVDALQGATGPRATLAAEARSTRARLTPDPAERRRLWLAIAAAEGRTPSGDAARAAALEALLEGATTPALATAALQAEDGAGNPTLLHRAIPDAPADGAGAAARTDALWRLAGSFPAGPWCEELATRLVAAGADLAVAERFEATCPDGASEDAGLLYAHAAATTRLRLTPRPGLVDAAASATTALQVTQHTVDPEALFRGTTGSGMNPLDSTLDAFLLEPDKAWTVPTAGLTTTAIAPRGAGPLAAITVRAGDQRATALVITEPLDVQLIGRGDDLAVAVLRGDRPVAGATLLVEDDTGVTRARTASDGIARLVIAGPVRVMATSGRGLGFATLGEAAAPGPAAESWSVVPWDRAVPVEGRTSDVQVFATGPAGGAVPSGSVVQVVSRALDGSTLGTVPVALTDGVGHARVFLQGGGRLTVERNGQQLASQSVPLLGAPRDGAVGVTLSTRSPRLGAGVVAHVHRLDGGAEALSAELVITTPWSEERRPVTLGAGTLDVPVDLRLSAAGDPVSVQVQLADGFTANAVAVVADPPAIPALGDLPALVELGRAIEPTLREPLDPVRREPGGWAVAREDTMVHAWQAGSPGLWVPIGAPITLPRPGEWTLCAWNGAPGESSTITVVDPAADGTLAADGRWRGPTTLVAATAEGIRSASLVRPGEPLPLAPAPGVRTGWVTAAEGTSVPVVGEPTPAITVDGVLRRGSATPLTIHAPAGSRVWAWVRDAAPGPAALPAFVTEQWADAPGVHLDDWQASDSWGDAISAGLLAEEERVEEATNVKRVDFEFSAAAERAMEDEAYGEGGLSGYGTGGGGFGSKGAGRGAARAAQAPSFAGEGAVLGTVEGAAPGSFPVLVPAWVGSADVEVVVRTADGRWATQTLPVAVTGDLAARPAVERGRTKPTADAAETLALALELPVDARLHVLEAMRGAGMDPAGSVADAAAAAWATSPAVTSEIAVARHLRGAAVEIPDTEAIPDPRHAERALAALLLSGGDESQRERARVSAERLLAEPGLESWAVARAALALWMAGHPEEAEAAAAEGPRDAVQGAALAVASGTGDPAMVDDWWAIARAPGATAADRALALHALLQPRARARAAGGRPLRPEHTRSSGTIAVQVEAPLARWRGETLERASFVNGSRIAGSNASLSQAGALQSPAGRTVPVHVVIPPFALPTRVSCPAGALTPWVDLPPALVEARAVDCTLVAGPAGTSHLAVSWTGPTGAPLATADLDLVVTPPRDSAPTDPMSDAEQLALGTRLATSVEPDAAATHRAAGLGLLEGLQRRAELPPDVLAALSATLLHGAVDDPVALIRAFQSFREHAPDGVLDLPVATALAHAYASAPASSGGDPRRALAAVRVVMDARFKEELAAVSELQSRGLDLTALKLLRELVARYPETPTVTRARFLAPAMLLTRAEGDGDRLGYTRSSLRHTAAGELAGFLLLHRDGWSGAPDARAAEQAARAASSLSDALTALGDEPRQASLAGPLAAAFAHLVGAEEVAWQLSLASAHATAAGGNPGKALGMLTDLAAPDVQGQGRILLERGRVLEALGRDDEAHAAYASATEHTNAEAYQRLEWLDRAAFTLPPTITLLPGMPFAVPASLKPGAEVTVTAIAIQLEAALLDSGGALDASAVRVTGLRPTASRTLRVGADGDVPLPTLPPGAYLLTVTAAGATQSSVLVRTDAELNVQGTGPSLLHLSTTLGRPLPGAQVWAFQGGGPALTARTDATGSAYFPEAVSTVLARSGDQYALGYAVNDPSSERLKALGYIVDGEYPAPAAPRRMTQDASDYEMLFDQDANQNVPAEGL